MIAKAGQPIGQRDFGHMATHAILCLNRASRGGSLTTGHSGSCTLELVARQAFRIVNGYIRNQILVGIVARDAADAWIGSAKTLAASQPIRLEAHVYFATPRAANNLLPTTMALPTKIGQILSCELSKIGRSHSPNVARICQEHVRICSYMAMLTSDAGFERIKRQPLSILHCIRRVAAKASRRFVWGKPSPQRLFERSWNNLKITDRDSEAANGRVVADEAFVVDAIALEYPSLRPVTKTPADRKRYGSSSVGYGIGALTTLGLNDVAETVFLKRQLGVRI